MDEYNISGFLKQLRKTSGYSANEVVEKLKGYNIDISSKTLYGYESGLSMLNADVFVALCLIYKCDNPMELFNSPSLTSREKDVMKKYQNLDTLGKEHVNTILQWETERMKSKKEEKPTRIISYYQKLASAGTGEYLFSDIPTDFIEVEDNEKSRNADFVIGVNGDSMKPVYNDGDKVFVKKTIELSVGEIGIFIDGNNCYIKELGENELISINKEYKNIKNLENVKVIGKVLDKVE